MEKYGSPGDDRGQADFGANRKINIGRDEDQQRAERCDPDDGEAVADPKQVLLRGERRGGEQERQGDRREQDGRHDFRTSGEPEKKRIVDRYDGACLATTPAR